MPIFCKVLNSKKKKKVFFCPFRNTLKTEDDQEAITHKLFYLFFWHPGPTACSCEKISVHLKHNQHIQYFPHRKTNTFV